MEHLLEESVSSADLKRFETRYHEEMAAGKITPSAQFEYAWCLVRSKYPADIRKGILLLEDLYQVRFQSMIMSLRLRCLINECDKLKDIFHLSSRIKMRQGSAIIYITLLLEMQE